MSSQRRQSVQRIVAENTHHNGGRISRQVLEKLKIYRINGCGYDDGASRGEDSSKDSISRRNKSSGAKKYQNSTNGSPNTDPIGQNDENDRNSEKKSELKEEIAPPNQNGISSDNVEEIDSVLKEAATLVSKVHIPCEKEVFVGGMPRQRGSSKAALKSNENSANFVWHANLFNFFKRYGVVCLIDINVDTSSGLPRGFAFVEFDDPWSALMCRMSIASERLIENNLCTVDWSRGTSEKEEKNLPNLLFSVPQQRMNMSSSPSHFFSLSCPNLMRRQTPDPFLRKKAHHPNLSIGKGFCTGGTRGSSAHSIQTYPKLPQLDEIQKKKELISKKSRSWAWSLKDPISWSGPGGTSVYGFYHSAHLRHNKKADPSDLCEDGMSQMLYKMGDKNLQEMAMIAFDSSKKRTDKSKNCFAKFSENAENKLKQKTLIGRKSPFKYPLSIGHLKEKFCLTAPVSTTTSCSASPNSYAIPQEYNLG
mmetsp:Transcript_20740/g.30692  ORF Transcript_20740/g.30692 Transcript_20740/m.30692 type:complete len:478 (-) Transcript_20740:346-1779(-)